MGRISRPLHLARTVLPLSLLASGSLAQQAPTSAAAVTHLLGTVSAVQGDSLTLTPDHGDATTLLLSPETRVLDLPPGSTDLKAANAGSVGEISVGDRVLITGRPGSGGAPSLALRVVMMRSAAIAQARESQQASWAHSIGGAVRAIDGATGAITVSSNGKTITIVTKSNTIFRRYAADSARFQDSQRSSMADLHVGDQVRVRGEIAATQVQAAEIVSGTFEQISGSIVAIDESASTLTLRDLRTKKTLMIKVTARTELHQLPPEIAARFAARSKEAGEAPAHKVTGGTDPDTGRRHDDGDLGRIVAQLPDLSVSTLKNGESVLLIATPNAGSLTAMTILSGVEPILSAVENGGAETSLAPWSVGSGEGANSATQ